MESKIKRRILFVVTQSELGGAQQFFNNFVPKLAENRFQCLVAIGSEGDAGLNSALKAKAVATQQLTYLQRDGNWQANLRAVSELRALIKDFQPDVLFLNGTKAGFTGEKNSIFF